jgi:hypothetical protein
MKSDSDPDFDIQTSKHRDQNRIFIQKEQSLFFSVNIKGYLPIKTALPEFWQGRFVWFSKRRMAYF